MQDVQRGFPSSYGTECLSNLVTVADSLLPFLTIVRRLHHGSTGDDGYIVLFQSKTIHVTVDVLKTVNAIFSRDNGLQRI